MALNVLKDIKKIYSALNADEIRGAAHHDLSVGLIAGGEQDYQIMERFLAPPAMDDAWRAECLRRIHRVNGRAFPHRRTVTPSIRPIRMPLRKPLPAIVTISNLP